MNAALNPTISQLNQELSTCKEPKMILKRVLEYNRRKRNVNIHVKLTFPDGTSSSNTYFHDEEIGIDRYLVPFEFIGKHTVQIIKIEQRRN